VASNSVEGDCPDPERVDGRDGGNEGDLWDQSSRTVVEITQVGICPMHCYLHMERGPVCLFNFNEQSEMKSRVD
jgi:hypothetical protein